MPSKKDLTAIYIFNSFNCETQCLDFRKPATLLQLKTIYTVPEVTIFHKITSAYSYSTISIILVSALIYTCLISCF